MDSTFRESIRFLSLRWAGLKFALQKLPRFSMPRPESADLFVFRFANVFRPKFAPKNAPARRALMTPSRILHNARMNPSQNGPQVQPFDLRVTDSRTISSTADRAANEAPMPKATFGPTTSQKTPNSRLAGSAASPTAPW